MLPRAVQKAYRCGDTRHAGTSRGRNARHVQPRIGWESTGARARTHSGPTSQSAFPFFPIFSFFSFLSITRDVGHRLALKRRGVPRGCTSRSPSRDAILLAPQSSSAAVFTRYRSRREIANLIVRGFSGARKHPAPKAPKTAAELKTRLQTGDYARRGAGESFAAAIAAGNSCRVGRTAVHISSISGVGATISGIMNTRAPEA